MPTKFHSLAITAHCSVGDIRIVLFTFASLYFCLHWILADKFFPATTSCNSLQMVFIDTVSKTLKEYPWSCWLAKTGHKFQFLLSAMIQSSCKVRDSNGFLLFHCLYISLWENIQKAFSTQMKLMGATDNYMSLNMRTLFWGLSNAKPFPKCSAKVVQCEQKMNFIFRNIRFTHLPGWDNHDYTAYSNALLKGHQHPQLLALHHTIFQFIIKLPSLRSK